MNPEARRVITRFKLQALPREGGFFRQTWAGPAAAPGGRPAGTAILYLMTAEDFSALHLLDTVETWHFYAGDPVELLQLHSDSGRTGSTLLGADWAAGQTPQAVVPAGVWQGARPCSASSRHGWSLTGCTLAPGWDERGFVLGKRAELQALFPAAADLIRAFTR